MIPGNQINNLRGWIHNMINLKEINSELKTELLEKDNVLNEFYQLKVENEELKSLLNLQIPPTTNKVVLAGEVRGPKIGDKELIEKGWQNKGSHTLTACHAYSCMRERQAISFIGANIGTKNI